MTPNEQTLAVYSAIAEEYRAKTLALDASSGREALSSRLPKGGRILDAGCGWGRDARAFLDDGFDVFAFDGSPEMAQMASELLGRPVPAWRFQDLDLSPSSFDGVWARASLLHLEPGELLLALDRLLAALKPGGWLFACFKEGDAERVDGAGRWFTDMTRPRFEGFLARVSTPAQLIEHFSTDDQFGRPQRWANFLVRRS